MGRFDGILICTDLDGTLLNSEHRISKENLEAIEYFKREGGFFTFVTGRMPFFVSNMYEAVQPNAPYGCVNGGGLYDHRRQAYIWTREMPRSVMSLIQSVDEHFPGVGIQVNTFHHTYFCKENLTMEQFRAATGLPNLVRNYEDVDEPIAKIVFGSESDEEILEIHDHLFSHPLASNFDFIRSERTLYEILPKGSGKGTSIVQLCRHLNLDPHKTIALGDYNNDISMFQEAEVGIAVSNACPEALEAADYVTVSNDEHAVCQVIRDLEAGKFLP